MNNGSNSTEVYDLLVIGGGINGAGVARDAAGRGMSVLLCEKEDLAQHTSSASTKLIHGGLRYLEHYDFKLVRHALQEREVLLRAAPHIIWPLKFILPHHQELRPKWLIRIGLFLYDHIGGRKLLPASHSVDLRTDETGVALNDKFVSGFEYSDCWVQDARLVSLTALDAAERGCIVRTHTEVKSLSRNEGLWSVDIHDNTRGISSNVTAKCIVNASGPWVENTLNLETQQTTQHSVRLVKGSHIVVPKLFEHNKSYIFQNADNRIIFAIPYETDYTLLGTTDVEVSEEPGVSKISDEEIGYICSAASEYFKEPVSASDVVWAYSGVRPLYDDASINASKVTRDYKLHLDQNGAAPILSIYGGKITTYRKLAEEVMSLVDNALGIESKQWTSGKALPGGDIQHANYNRFLNECQTTYSWLPKHVCSDYARNYGTRIRELIGDEISVEGLGFCLDGVLFQAEVDYLMNYEWARAADDVLWRRTKKGLRLSKESVVILDNYMEKSLKGGRIPAANSN